jgi:hypothetical protein
MRLLRRRRRRCRVGGGREGECVTFGFGVFSCSLPHRLPILDGMNVYNCMIYQLGLQVRSNLPTYPLSAVILTHLA